MVPKRWYEHHEETPCFRAVLFRMVPKQCSQQLSQATSFRAVLFRMVPKRKPPLD